jgi:hypothetical protein
MSSFDGTSPYTGGAIPLENRLFSLGPVFFLTTIYGLNLK